MVTGATGSNKEATRPRQPEHVLGFEILSAIGDPCFLWADHFFSGGVHRGHRWSFHLSRRSPTKEASPGLTSAVSLRVDGTPAAATAEDAPPLHVSAEGRFCFEEDALRCTLDRSQKYFFFAVGSVVRRCSEEFWEIEQVNTAYNNMC